MSWILLLVFVCHSWGLGLYACCGFGVSEKPFAERARRLVGAGGKGRRTGFSAFIALQALISVSAPSFRKGIFLVCPLRNGCMLRNV